MSEEKNENEYLSYGIGFGLLGGALLAVILGGFFDTLFGWFFAPGFGLLLGTLIGIKLDTYKKNE